MNTQSPSVSCLFFDGPSDLDNLWQRMENRQELFKKVFPNIEHFGDQDGKPVSTKEELLAILRDTPADQDCYVLFIHITNYSSEALCADFKNWSTRLIKKCIVILYSGGGVSDKAIKEVIEASSNVGGPLVYRIKGRVESVSISNLSLCAEYIICEGASTFANWNTRGETFITSLDSLFLRLNSSFKETATAIKITIDCYLAACGSTTLLGSLGHDFANHLSAKKVKELMEKPQTWNLLIPIKADEIISQLYNEGVTTDECLTHLAEFLNFNGELDFQTATSLSQHLEKFFQCQ